MHSLAYSYNQLRCPTEFVLACVATTHYIFCILSRTRLHLHCPQSRRRLKRRVHGRRYGVAIQYQIEQGPQVDDDTMRVAMDFTAY